MVAQSNFDKTRKNIAKQSLVAQEKCRTLHWDHLQYV